LLAGVKARPWFLLSPRESVAGGDAKRSVGVRVDLDLCPLVTPALARALYDAWMADTNVTADSGPTQPASRPVAPVLVLVPAGWAARSVQPIDLGQAELIQYRGWREAVSWLRADARPAVLWSDGLGHSDLPTVATVVRQRSAMVIEVRAERWDGETQSPLSAACRGVISGFAESGVAAAVRLAVAG
jgi:hypothetical protein